MHIVSSAEQHGSVHTAGSLNHHGFERLPALEKLRDDIHRIEETYPALHAGLTDICDEVIARFRSHPAPQVSEIKSGKTNLFTLMLDRTGYYLISGLDKAGDGIIFVFENVLKLFRSSNGYHGAQN